MDFVKYAENRLKENKFIKSYFGGSSTINAGMALVMLVIALIYSEFHYHHPRFFKNQTMFSL